MHPRPFLLAALLLAPSIADAQISGQRVARTIRDPNQTILEALPPPPPGPPPQGLRFESPATWGIFAKIAWNPAPNAIGYEVSRGKRDDATCCNATSGRLPASATSWTDMGLFKAGYYSYTITVYYAGGSVGTAGIDLLTQHDGTPTITVQDLGLGRLRFEWHRDVVPGTCCVVIKGPGLGPSGEKLVLGGGPMNLPILPAGTHTWTVAAAYNADNLPLPSNPNYGAYSAHGGNYVVLAPPSEWATFSHTVRYGVGRYRISLEGFKAISVTAEDPFRNDGRGDEVFITTQVSEYWRNGRLQSTRMVRTPTFGDKHNFPARVQAGSASPQGGIMPNDAYPVIPQLVAQLQPATTSNLPYLLWEGELTEIDNAVILSPAVWESDEGDELVPYYRNFQQSIASSVGYYQKFGPYIPNTYGSPMLDTWNPQRSCPVPLSKESPRTLFVPPIGGWRDEPIDMNQDHSYCPTYVAINWRLANSLTTVNRAAVVEIPFESPVAGWKYKLFVRVEKL